MSMEALVNAELIAENLNRKSGELPDRLKQLVGIVAFAVDREVKLESPVITGNLQGATSIENISDFEKRIYPDEGIAPYAIYVIKGTPPHDIFPVSAKALFWEGADHPYGKVHHPGTKADDYFSRGLANAESDKDSAVDDFVNWLTT